MSDISSLTGALNLYEEDLNEETSLDLSSQGHEILPEINNKFICVLYLQNNKIKTLPHDFFPFLSSLMWLDLRDNQLTDIPKTIRNHPSLTHFLLTNNQITSLPNELGTLKNLKVLQLSGNPLRFPPKHVTSAGLVQMLNFLQERYLDELFLQSQTSVADENEPEPCVRSTLESFSNDARSYNSVLDEEKLNNTSKPLSVQFSEKDTEDSDEEYYNKVKGKCHKLPKSRLKTLSLHCQSSKYLKKSHVLEKEIQEDKMKQSLVRQLAMEKEKELLATREKILQGRRNIELLRNWRQNYRIKHLSMPRGSDSYKAEPKNYPYDTSPEYMTLLTREDIEKDLPDKYRRKLFRKPKPTVPRKNKSDVHLAMKIKQLFENLEAIDLNRESMTPRTEQKVLLGEIQKISEIKQKLMELSTTNMKSVTEDL